jgi:protein-disulfide isomerase
VSAAMAVECVALQGDVGSFVDLTFVKQDSVGLKSWPSYAAEAGIPDLPAVEACLRSPPPMPRIDRGLALAQELGLKGTPSVVVNGWVYPAPPPAEELSRVIGDFAAGRDPLSGVLRREH